jgi:hypothetical protein
MSKIEVDAIDKQSGSTLTLGGSGTAVTLACGATQSGFGRSGSVNWQTGSIKTTTFTAADGEGYFIDTSSGAVTANLPAGSAGAIVSFSDYTRTFGTNALTIVPNGSNKIGGVAANAALTIDGQAATFVFVDATEGWINVQNAEDTESGATFIVATGGNATLTNGDFKTHVFTSPGTFCVSGISNVATDNAADYVVIGGGGGAGTAQGGGGGAGGFRLSNDLCMPAPTTSPLANPTALTLTASPFPITVGGGGAAGALPNGDGTNGSVSTFSTVCSAGGGKGKGSGTGTGFSGGSGSGAKGGPTSTSGFCGGAGNTPPVSPPQGQPGGKGYDGVAISTNAGGGGGAGAAGGNAANQLGGTGGDGSYIADAVLGPTAPSYGTPGPVGSTRFFAGGGGGSSCSNPAPNTAPGGAGGGGTGGADPTTAGGAGTANTGAGGGGGRGSSSIGGAGGSGIVIIRYKFQ